MGDVLTSRNSFNAAAESTLGAQPTAGWFQLEAKAIRRWGATYTKTARSFISEQRSRRKGAITDVSSGFEYDCDLTRSVFRHFVQGFLFADMTTLQGTAHFVPTAVVDGGGSPDEFTVAAGGDLDAGTLIYTRGFTNAANNGLNVVVATSTTTAIKVATGTLVAEAAPPKNVELDVCGVEGATGDIQIDANGDLISTVLDFTTLGLTVGQWIYLPTVGSTHGFATAGNEGFAQVTAIAAAKLTLARRDAAYSADTAAGIDIRIYFGQFVCDLATSDANFREESFHVERVMPNLGAAAATRYQYAAGNRCNEAAFQFPLTALASCGFNFLGQITGDPTGTRATMGAGEPLEDVSGDAFGTPSNLPRLRLAETDETVIGSGAMFKDITINLRNGVTEDKRLGSLGAVNLPWGTFEFDIDMTAVLTDEAVLTALKDNRTLSMTVACKNDDGGMIWDAPAMTIDGGEQELEIGQVSRIRTTGKAHRDDTLGYCCGISLFPYLP